MGKRKVNIIDAIKNTANGLATLKDWLGDDLKHVTQEHADHRSLACLAGNGGNECPHHVAAKWWEFAKGEIADAIRAQMAVKEQIKFSTPLEESLKMCQICGCAMKLKVWTPIEHIKAHTSPEQASKYPVHCWQKTELAAS